MAEEEIHYTIPYFASGGGFNSGPVAGDGVIADLIVTYDPTKQNADGSYTVTGVVSGTRELTDGAGNPVATDKITGLAPQDPTFPSEITFSNGTLNPVFISYDVSTPADGNNPSTGEVDFSGRDNGGGLAYEELGDNFEPATSFSANPVCFVSGTMIATARGDVAVEHLMVGDAAITSSGSVRPIVWIGRRVTDCAAQAIPSESWPVRVRAGAFGGGLPERDLFLSPGHPVVVADRHGEILVPIMCLINGTSIDRVPVDTVTYWHVELDQHDILLADGLPAESYLDFGNRAWFANAAAHALLNPDFIPPGLGGRCRPVVIDGPRVELERRRLDQLFEAELTAHSGWSGEADEPCWI